jgi:ubiquitin carboxyl-terminal hydrolase 5/13
MKANTFSRQEEVKAWEQEYTSCEHILLLQQEPPRQIQSQDLGHCSLCELQENLWLCLQCGNLGCGRAQFGGVGGHSHALEHKNTVGHAVAVKLGSITPDGTADVYCYACDDERLDENLGAHLANWGIILTERQKTEKSLSEMQVEENMRWDFSMTNDAGGELKKLFGPGFTGLKNLGNSCYLASTLQCLFAQPQFQARYYLPTSELPVVEDPAQDLETQLRKLGDGLLSGRYSRSDPDATASESPSDVPFQRGLAPAMLKHLIGRGHSEFSTMRQQDAFEFLLHVFKLITRSQHSTQLQDPTRCFRFVMEQRLQCLSCKKVRYSSDEQDNISIPVPIRKILLPAIDSGEAPGNKKADEYEAVTLKECLDTFTSSEHVELTCSACGSKDGFSKRSLFKTFPEVLAVNARRFNLINWVPTKVNVPVVVGDDPFLLDAYKSPGQHPSEELLPEDASDGKPSFVANPEAVQMLEGMGFPRVRCERALHATGNSDGNAAMEWLFAHMEDPDIDQPQDFGAGQTGGTADPEKIEMLGAMGFGPPQARKALKETGGDVERAVEWLFNHPDDQGEFEDDQPAASEPVAKEVPGSSDIPASFQLQSIICHKGASIHAGYVSLVLSNETPS